MQDELQCAEEKLQALKDKVQQLQAEKASQEERAQTAEMKLEEYRSDCQVPLINPPFQALLVQLQQVRLASMYLIVDASRSEGVMKIALEVPASRMPNLSRLLP